MHKSAIARCFTRFLKLRRKSTHTRGSSSSATATAAAAAAAALLLVGDFAVGRLYGLGVAPQLLTAFGSCSV